MVVVPPDLQSHHLVEISAWRTAAGMLMGVLVELGVMIGEMVGEGKRTCGRAWNVKGRVVDWWSILACFY
jgi:hypothetical protein